MENGKYGIDPWRFVEMYYTIPVYMQTWAPEWHPIPHEAYWPPPDLELMPDAQLERGKGRPMSTRIHNEMDAESSSRGGKLCGICRERGHNRSKCPLRITPVNP